MPRKTDPITIAELEEIRAQLMECQLGESLKDKLYKRIDAEIERREKAGKGGGRPKVIEEIKRIDAEGIAQSFAEQTIHPTIQTSPESSNEQESDDNWIEMPQTFANGEILYWHRKLKGKPVCYRRESDLGGA